VIFQGEDKKIAAYLMAGGGSTRFGRDKALAEFSGEPMLARMLKLMTEFGENAKVVAAPGKYSEFGATIVEDHWPGEGPLGGIVTALAHTRENTPACEWNLVVSCDMPFLTREWLAYLLERAEKSEAQVVLAHSENGPEPLCACWRTNAMEILRTAFEDGVRRVTQGIALLRAEVLDEADWKRFDSEGRLFWNMNTAADYEEARRIVEAERK
jgi:molybdopterin-guanine dinucleotide biosynthesis protein A